MGSGSVLLDHNQTAEKRIQDCFRLLVDGSDEALLDLIQGLRLDPSPIVRHECAYSLGEIDSDKGVDSLIEAIYKDLNPLVRHEAALAVSNLGKGEEAIRHLMDNEDPDLVDTAEISFRRFEMRQTQTGIPRNPAEVVLDLSEHPEHRIQAAFKLLDTNSEASIDILLQALEQETNSIVKHEIIFCLGEVASSRVVEPLIRHMMEDDNIFVKHEAALALGTLGYPEAEAPLRLLLKHTNPNVVESAEIALERLLPPS